MGSDTWMLRQARGLSKDDDDEIGGGKAGEAHLEKNSVVCRLKPGKRP